MPFTAPRLGGYSRDYFLCSLKGTGPRRSWLVESPEARGGAQPKCGTPTPSYLNSPLPIPPGDLVRSVAGEGDVVFPVKALGCFLRGFGELEKIKYSR